MADRIERAALVTGASSGIGLATARALGKEKYALTISARGAERLDAAVEDLRGEGVVVEGVVADMNDAEEVTNLVATHRDHYGQLDVLANNAGLLIRSPIDDIQTQDLDAQFAVNVRALIVGTREAMPLLRESATAGRKALIINTASIAGKGGNPQASVYAAMKAAVVNFTQSTYYLVSSEGIQCTALVPGYVDTPLVESVKTVIPAEEMVRPSDISEAVGFLLRTSPSCHIPEITFLNAQMGLTPWAR